MKEVGLRELKKCFSKYIRLVRAGQVVVVTHRGRPVAELCLPGDVPPGTKIDAALTRLANRGVLTLGGSNTPRVYPRLARLLRTTTSAKLLDAERGAQ